MHVLTVYAHPSPKSFCYAVLEQFNDGLHEAGHTNEVLDLYAIGFDPILRTRDGPSWLLERYTHPTDALKAQALDSFMLEETPSNSEAGSADGQGMGNAEIDEWKRIGGRREARTRGLRVANEPGEVTQLRESKRPTRRRVRSL